MHETTQITYGSGTVSVVFNSESLSEVAAPYFRAGDYNEILTSCLTKKELERIDEGDYAEVTFNFVMSDEIADAQLRSQFDAAIESAERSLGNLEEGVFFETDSYKAFGGDDSMPIGTLDHEFELQIEIPLYLRKDNREYYVIVNNMGVCELCEDIDEEADTLSISVDSLGSCLMLYRDGASDLEPGSSSGPAIRSHYLFIAAILALLALWFAVDKFHSRNE